MMSSTDGVFSPPNPRNEPVQAHAPGSAERARIANKLDQMAGEEWTLPNVINGERFTEGDRVDVVMPHDHQRVIGHFHLANAATIDSAFEAARGAQAQWAAAPWEDRAAVFLKAAELLAGPWRDEMNASTMLGQSKTVHQAEIDAACELIDFWRYNVHFARQIYADQPRSTSTSWNRSDHRPLEGVVAAITPFNFSSIAGNLATAPALMGNSVVWKPASTQAHCANVIMRLLESAGLPKGVINLVHGRGAEFGAVALKRRDLAGVHFTGSTGTFQSIWKGIAANIENYAAYPRLVGETGGKDFILAHASADPAALAVAIVRGGFEYQGQKCSAASRIYLPSNLADEVLERSVAMVSEMKMGDVRDMSNFLGAVINKRSFDKISAYMDLANKSAKVLVGGGVDDSTGYFIAPTLAQVDDPHHRLMEEEIFGPLVAVYVYDASDFEGACRQVDTTSPYALTGAIFAQDRTVIGQATDALRFSAGNFYINDKPSGAVVGMQPFGGGRASGTNDKAGSVLNLLRWVSPRSIKENLVPPSAWTYPFLG
jgi:1-pyrroline-5-carboxylate dehydrogenase